MASLYFIDADVTFLETAAGGRTNPLHLETPVAHYRPHIVVGDPLQRVPNLSGKLLTESYLGVEFQPQDLTIYPGDSARVELGLMFYPAPEYEVVQPGATFTIREGAKIIGYGRVASSINERPIASP